MSEIHATNLEFMDYLKEKGCVTENDVRQHFKDDSFITEDELKKYEECGFIRRKGDEIYFVNDEQQGLEIRVK